MSTALIIIHTGDSIAASGNHWPFQALGAIQVGDSGVPVVQTAATYYYGGRIIMRNAAIAGTRIDGTNGVGTMRPAYVDPVYALKTLSRPGMRPRKYLYINAIGTNDGAIGGYASVALYAAAVAADIASAKTLGADYGWIVSLLPRADGGAMLTEPNRLAYNALVNDPTWRAAHGVDDCIDVASAAHAGPQFLPANSGGDLTWYLADNIHPQDVLSIEMGVIALAKYNALLAVI